MIVASPKKYEIGQMHDELTDAFGKVHFMPVMILREATRKEWEECVTTNGGDINSWPNLNIDSYIYFYEVSID